MRPRLVGLHVDIRLFIEHYGGGSWHQGDLQRQSAWLKQHEALWSTPATQGKAASKREQSQTGLSSAEREQAHQGESLGKPTTAKRTNSKK
jgi:hypothetical protein